jgi:DNA repair exonuclease SbcCD ATPase subunit
MATVANLKAKLVMDVGQFEQAAEKAVGTAKRAGVSIGKALSNVGKDWERSMLNFGKALIGVLALDSGMRAFGRYLKELDTSKLETAADVISEISTGIGEALKAIPLIGGAYELGEGIGAVFGVGAEDKRRDAEDKARDAASLKAKALQDQVSAIRQYEERAEAIRGLEGEALAQKQAEFAIEDKLAKLKAAAVQGASPAAAAALVAQAREQLTQTMQKDLEAARERAKLEESIAAAKKQQAEEAAIIRQEDAAAASFLDGLKSQLEAVTLSERERLELQMQRLKLWPEEIEAATQLYEQIELAKKAQEEQRELDRLKAAADEEDAQNRKMALEAMGAAQRATNVETLDTAIGGVKVQGMMDSSLSRLVPVQEAMKAYLKAIADNTKPAAGGAP